MRSTWGDTWRAARPAPPGPGCGRAVRPPPRRRMGQHGPVGHEGRAEREEGHVGHPVGRTGVEHVLVRTVGHVVGVLDAGDRGGAARHPVLLQGHAAQSDRTDQALVAQGHHGAQLLVERHRGLGMAAQIHHRYLLEGQVRPGWPPPRPAAPRAAAPRATARCRRAGPRPWRRSRDPRGRGAGRRGSARWRRRARRTAPCRCGPPRPPPPGAGFAVPRHGPGAGRRPRGPAAASPRSPSGRPGAPPAGRCAQPRLALRSASNDGKPTTKVCAAPAPRRQTPPFGYPSRRPAPRPRGSPPCRPAWPAAWSAAAISRRSAR